MKKLIDTHRHLGGSINPEFIWKIISSEDHYRYLAESYQDVVSQMTYDNDKIEDVIAKDFSYFLNKFKILDEIQWTEQLIDETIRQVSYDFEAEGLYGVLLDFSVNKYMNIGWHKHEAVKFIKQCFDKYCTKVKVGLILSVKYENTKASLKQHIQLIEHPDVADSITGIDMVGDENFYDPALIGEYLYDWLNAGKMVRAHVGEIGPSSNVLTALRDLQVTNIAHGLNILGSKEAVEIARDKGIYFDLGLSSNIFTGVATTSNHPVYDMIKNGLQITVGTDDPHVFCTDIYHEYALLKKSLLSHDDSGDFVSNSINMIMDNGLNMFRRWFK